MPQNICFLIRLLFCFLLDAHSTHSSWDVNVCTLHGEMVGKLSRPCTNTHGKFGPEYAGCYGKTFCCSTLPSAKLVQTANTCANAKNLCVHGMNTPLYNSNETNCCGNATPNVCSRRVHHLFTPTSSLCREDLCSSDPNRHIENGCCPINAHERQCSNPENYEAEGGGASYVLLCVAMCFCLHV